ncbi:hypothetical protein AE1304_25690 [Aeromonas enteropelogenes]
MLPEFAAQRALTDAGLFGKCGERAIRQLTALDPRQQTGERMGQIAAGSGGELGATAQARAQAILFGGSGTWEVAHIVFVRRPGRADGAAVDAGGDDTGKEAAIEACIAGKSRGVALLSAEAVERLFLQMVVAG